VKVLRSSKKLAKQRKISEGSEPNTEITDINKVLEEHYKDMGIPLEYS
jgi:hypothetical protein